MKRVSRLIAISVFVCIFIMAILLFVLIFGKMDETVEAYGSVLPLDYVEVSPERSGIIKRIEISDGDIVEPGDTLILLCDENLQFELEQARLSLERAQNRLTQAREQYRNLDESESFETSAEFANLRRAKTEYEYHKSEYGRMTKFYEKGLCSMEDLEREKYLFNMAEEYYLALEKRLEMLRNQYQREIENGISNVKTAQHTYELAQWNLQKCVITAPRAGTVMAPEIENLAGTMAVEGQSLVRICNLSSMGFLARISEKDIPRIEIGQDVHLFINAFPHSKYGILPGKVATIPSLPRVTQNGVIYEVKVSIESLQEISDSLEICLTAGMTGKAEIVIERDVRLIAQIFEGIAK